MFRNGDYYGVVNSDDLVLELNEVPCVLKRCLLL